jgi:hypothetical protein
MQGAKPLESHPKTLRDLTHAIPLLTLPASFGEAHLGETFRSCLCLNNETNFVVYGVTVKVEMQTATTKLIIAELRGNMDASSTMETIVSHEIKETGQHVLGCSVTYSQPDSQAPNNNDRTRETRSFSKFYKFAVSTFRCRPSLCL